MAAACDSHWPSLLVARGPHPPPSVVVSCIQGLPGDEPMSLLQETLKLYPVRACSPGTSHWKGGTVALMSLVFMTSPILRLTSLI